MKRLPDDIWLANQKISSQKLSKKRQKIINYIEKYYKPQSRCMKCNRKGSVFEQSRESVKIRCPKCKKVWLFYKKFSSAFLPKALFARPKRKVKEKKINTVFNFKPYAKPISSKQILIKQKNDKKILEILKGNVTIKLSTQ